MVCRAPRERAARNFLFCDSCEPDCSEWVGCASFYNKSLTTSRFGEANVEWSIPENARLEDYSVEVYRQSSSRIWAQSIKISRYELPNFTISIKPDRPY